MDGAALVSAACLGTFKWRKVAPHNGDVIHLYVQWANHPSPHPSTLPAIPFLPLMPKRGCGGAVGASIVRSNHIGSNIETKPTVNYGQWGQDWTHGKPWIFRGGWRSEGQGSHMMTAETFALYPGEVRLWTRGLWNLPLSDSWESSELLGEERSVEGKTTAHKKWVKKKSSVFSFYNLMRLSFKLEPGSEASRCTSFVLLGALPPLFLLLMWWLFILLT